MIGAFHFLNFYETFHKKSKDKFENLHIFRFYFHKKSAIINTM